MRRRFASILSNRQIRLHQPERQDSRAGFTGNAACLMAALLMAALLIGPAAQPVRAAPPTTTTQPDAAPLLGVTALAAGGDHTCVLKAGGEVQCWGWNNYGQIGDVSTEIRLTPVTVVGLAGGVRAIATGYAHSCALTGSGGVRCWGSDEFGQLGDGSTGDTNNNRLTPVDVTGLASGVSALAAGDWHTCALTGGQVQCWGANESGQLGDGTTETRLTPVGVTGLDGVIAIDAGSGHTCALTSGGEVKCWGQNNYGQIGDGTGGNFGDMRLTPVTVDTLPSGVIAITAGYHHSCALTTGGGARCWGGNEFGQLGDGTTGDDNNMRLTPVGVSGLTQGATTITAGDRHTCALAGGGVQCWGENASGQLGDGQGGSYGDASLTPVEVSGLQSGVTALAAGGGHSCALTTGGRARCWGENASGQLGDGTTGDANAMRLTPVDVVAGATACTAAQWQAAYFDNLDLQTAPTATTCEGAVDFFWGQGGPSAGGPVNNWSARWRHTLEIQTAGWYELRAFADDGLRLYVDGQPVIDDWGQRAFAERVTVQRLAQGLHEITLEYADWTGDALAHLTWYRAAACANDAATCAPRLAALTFQTEAARLSIAQPKTCQNAPGQTLAAYGALLTSISMGLQAYGIDTSPEELNLWLSQADTNTGVTPRGYAGVCDAGLMWGYIPLFAEEKAQAQGRDVRLKWQTTGDTDGVLGQGYPVLMQVADGKHWVLATGTVVAGGVTTQSIADPWHSYQCTVTAEEPVRSALPCTQSTTPLPLQHATTAVEEGQYRGKPFPFRYLAPRAGARTPSLQINARHVEILLVDEQWRRTGFDPASGQTVAGIPNSSYHNGEIVPPGGQPSGELQRVLFLAENGARVFSLRVFSPPGAAAGTPFEVTLTGLDAQGNLAKVTGSGRVAAGQVLRYVVEYREDGTLKLTPASDTPGEPGGPGNIDADYLPLIHR